MPDAAGVGARNDVDAGEAGFREEWLALREAADHRSRAVELLPPLAQWWGRRSGIRIVDLASGTGSNLRYLAPRLPGPQSWVLVDRDPDLLSRAPGSPGGKELPEGVREVRAVGADLAAEGLGSAAGADLVTCSAFLDLVSREWLTDLVEVCRAEDAAVLLALTYSGSLAWTAGDGSLLPGPGDDVVRNAVNLHQRRDKGFGPALGPLAAPEAEAAFASAGFETRLEPSTWRLGPEDEELARELLRGWVRAAVEERPSREAEIREWAGVRRSTLKRRDFSLTVGHLDLLALP